MSKQIKRISLRVSEGNKEDVGKNIVRLDPEMMKEARIREGTPIEIRGRKITGAIAGSPLDKDEGQYVIHMDGLIRNNSGSSLGDMVKIRKIRPKNAERVKFAPVKEGVKITSPRHVAQALKKSLLGRLVRTADLVSVHREVATFALGEIKFVCVSTRPVGIVKINEDSIVSLYREPPDYILYRDVLVTYEDIGGLEDEIIRVREMIELPLRYPEIFDRLGITPPKGVLLHGPPGCGKTLLAKAVANESDAYFIPINGPEIMSKFYGESEKKIREIFNEAARNAPAIIFIDEIDSIAPKREAVTGEVERRVVAQFLALMDGLETRGRVIVIAATNRLNAVDTALRRPGRFDREIEIGVPDKYGRKEILDIHTRAMPLEENVDLEELAARTHGFAGADLASVSREAAMNCLKRVMPMIDLDDAIIPEEVLSHLKVKKKDFEVALRLVEPSAMREVLLEIPNVPWKNVGGLKNIKMELKEAVELPIKRPEIFQNFSIRPTSGILLFGPSGTGKTLLAKAIATETEANFIPVRGPEIFSKWVGESEKTIREIFRKARLAAPSIVFFDEIDAIASSRDRSGGNKVNETVVNQLLSELDGMQGLSQIVVIAATNRDLDMIDAALLRPGRFDKILYVHPPNEKERLRILEIHTKNIPISGEKDLHYLAKNTQRFTGADLESLCREAVLTAVRENKNITEIPWDYFIRAFNEIRPSFTQEIEEKYEKMAKKYVKKH
ncbi:MAG: CDC48 family AAA ATPase [Candidatus Lokiarchaeota archaeon]|nr:CDC48 family AAA ATPase [Candidatus Lokiarchaeota archaeon]